MYEPTEQDRKAIQKFKPLWEGRRANGLAAGLNDGQERYFATITAGGIIVYDRCLRTTVRMMSSTVLEFTGDICQHVADELLRIARGGDCEPC